MPIVVGVTDLVKWWPAPMLTAPQKTRGGMEMAIDIHIKFDGIDGESTDRDHKGEIEVLSWN
jgi:type VI secretion system (T6SS) effector Hcp